MIRELDAVCGLDEEWIGHSLGGLGKKRLKIVVWEGGVRDGSGVTYGIRWCLRLV